MDCGLTLNSDTFRDSIQETTSSSFFTKQVHKALSVKPNLLCHKICATSSYGDLGNLSINVLNSA